MKEIDKVTRKRLIYVKRLHMHAQEHISKGTDFDKMVAVHHLDNALELLLKCVAASYDISFKSAFVTFPTLWNRVNERYEEEQGSKLQKKTEMFHLHRIRSDVQHWGVSPFSLDAVKDFDEYMHSFIQTILNSVFGVKYNELFMSSLVNDITIRGLLTDAERYFADENWKDTVIKASVAFAFAKRKALRNRNLSTVPRIGEGGVDVDTLALGLDIEEYKRFFEKTPTVWLTGEEPITRERRELNYTRENALFCFNFALDSILRWRL